MKTESLIARIYFLIRPYGRKKLALVLGFSFIQATLQVIGVTSIFPFFSIATDADKFRNSDIGNSLLKQLPELNDNELLIWAGVCSLSLIFISSVVNISSQLLRSRYVQGFSHWLRVKLIQQIAAQPYSYFVKSEPAILNKKILADVQVFSNGILQAVLEILAGILSILLLLLSILAIDLFVSLGALATVGGFYILIFWFLRESRNTINNQLKSTNRKINSASLNFFNGIKVIKVFGAEKYYIDRYSQYSESLSKMNARMPIYLSIPKNLIEPVIFGALIIYVFLILSKGDDFGDVIPVLSVIALAGYRMIPAVQILYARFSQISTWKYALDEVFEEITQVEEYEHCEKSRTPANEAAIFSIDKLELIDISFSYPPSRKVILKKLNLDISKGDAIAITGQSGVGKSTLIDIILGLYTPDSGNILINGQPLTQEQIPLLQSKIGYVQQDCFLSNDSIRANIAFGIKKYNIDENLVLRACKLAQIMEFISNDLDNGLDTIVGERGVKLSGGQRQRIALARALYRTPEILILDEATSALDNETETMVTEAIDNLQGNVTLVVVAHRNNTIKNIRRKYQIVAGELKPCTS